jgi:ketosteroid isomerase-like protein
MLIDGSSRVGCMDRTTAQTWLDDYVSAWKSYDADAIGALFAEDVSYRYYPNGDPIVGRDALVSSWLEERDAPDTYDGHYTPYAVDGAAVVATGTSVYQDHPEGPVTRTYDNCFLIRFDDDGRATEFTEFYKERGR